MIYFTSDLHLGHKTEEVWKDVVGYKGLYQVSNIGRVKRLAHTREINPKGYKQIVSYKEKIISPCRTDRYIQLQFRLMRTRHGKAVDQYDKNGKFIATYDCANDVEPEYSVSHVISCCKKKEKVIKILYGYITVKHLLY